MSIFILSNHSPPQYIFKTKLRFLYFSHIWDKHHNFSILQLKLFRRTKECFTSQLLLSPFLIDKRNYQLFADVSFLNMSLFFGGVCNYNLSCISYIHMYITFKCLASHTIYRIIFCLASHTYICTLPLNVLNLTLYIESYSVLHLIHTYVHDV